MPKTKTDRGAQLRNTRQTREIQLRAADVDVDARTVQIAFSSETPVRRYWGFEILDHSPGSVRMNRIKDGAPLLVQHRSGDQIGVIESARIDTDDRTGRSVVRFSRSRRGEEFLQDVADGIRTKISVGYEIYEVRLDSEKDGVETYRIISWEPIEVSIVSIPADATVGVGRELQQPEEFPMPKETNPKHVPPTGDPVDPVAPETRSNPDPIPHRDDRLPDPSNPVQPPEETANHREMLRIGEHFGMRDMAADHVMLGTSLTDFRAMVREQAAARIQPVPSAPRIEARIPHAGNLRAYRPEVFAGGRQEAEEHAYRAGQFCRATIFGNEDAMRWCRDHGVQLSIASQDGRATRALTGIGAGQSVIVPDELVLPIISLREEYGLARRVCTIHPMASDTASVPRDTGDASAYFVGREQAPTTSDPTLDNINLTAKNVAAETRISNDYADDSVINLADYVAQKHARAFAVKEDQCLINGDGTSTYGGIVGLRTAILGLAGAIDAASGNDTFAEITAVDLRNVTAILPDIPGIMPSWYTSKPGQNLLFGRLTDAAGGNTKRDLSSQMPDQWGGYGIETSPAMPKVATDLSDVAMVLFGDLSMGVILGDRRGMTMLVDPYSLSSYQQTKIINSERFDINCHGVGDATDPGPVVALIGE